MAHSKLTNHGVLAAALFSFSLCSFAGEAAHPKPKYGPEGKPYVTTLAANHDYFLSTKHLSPKFWALIGYYVPQYTEASCSAASISMVLNAARAQLPKTSEDKLILQPDLVEKVTTQHWKERMSKDGYGDKKLRGTSLDTLREITEAAFKTYGFLSVKVEAVHVRDLSEKTLSQIHQALIENEKSPGTFLVSNFDQKVFTDDSTAGHFAPVAAYDSAHKKVLIMDPDREWYEPYWADEKRFAEAMHTQDDEIKDYRGYLIIRLASPSKDSSPQL
jgi:hypothetical protein